MCMSMFSAPRGQSINISRGIFPTVFRAHDVLRAHLPASPVLVPFNPLVVRPVPAETSDQVMPLQGTMDSASFLGRLLRTIRSEHHALTLIGPALRLMQGMEDTDEQRRCSITLRAMLMRFAFKPANLNAVIHRIVEDADSSSPFLGQLVATLVQAIVLSKDCDVENILDLCKLVARSGVRSSPIGTCMADALIATFSFPRHARRLSSLAMSLDGPGDETVTLVVCDVLWRSNWSHQGHLPSAEDNTPDALVSLAARIAQLACSGHDRQMIFYAIALSVVSLDVDFLLQTSMLLHDAEAPREGGLVTLEAVCTECLQCSLVPRHMLRDLARQLATLAGPHPSCTMLERVCASPAGTPTVLRESLRDTITRRIRELRGTTDGPASVYKNFDDEFALDEQSMLALQTGFGF
eukprot:TRINITY_DN13839_c0_g1_i2.p1 TRINITY_DN13839_c0_g1~~TRINITY_DN13839_c0_g1_i2.p1  ORF type:complete len:427 (+),score=71.87 TRINITY_DN13839_c0_g1_i2:57-1283(+)